MKNLSCNVCVTVLVMVMSVCLTSCDSYFWTSGFESEGLFYVIQDGDKEVHVTGIYNKDSLTDVLTIPASVRQYGKDYKVVRIGKTVFYGMKSLKQVYLPETIESIGEGAFDECPNIRLFFCPTIEPPLIMNTSFDPSIFTQCELYVPHASLYQEADGWKSFVNIHNMDK